MTLPPLTIIPAGAGSGKTHKIQKQLGNWICEGLVAPERIVAVTFTEAAAAELRERISSQLLIMGRMEDALRLSQAYISTIHGFGLRILTEFAFECGSSPQPRLLNEDEKHVLFSLALARTDKVKVNEIISNLVDFGYTYDHKSDRSAEDVFRDDLRRFSELLQSLSPEVNTAIRATQTVKWIAQYYGQTEDGNQLSTSLRESVEALLKEYPESLYQKFPGNATATKEFRRDFKNLKQALNGDVLDSDWKLWEDLRELRQSKHGKKLPDRYDQLSSLVIEAANKLPSHPGPLEHAQRHIKALLSAGQEVLSDYVKAKQESGLVEYSDMIAMAGQLLQTNPDVLKTLVKRVGCLVVDEFQDTNPLQFALLWQLKEAGVPTIIVGDLKQAIMGFQGADPRLFEALIEKYRKVSQPLKQNFRSQRPLMDLVNTLGPGLFGSAYVTLEPKVKAEDSQLKPLDVVSFPKKAKRKQHAVRAAAVGERLKALLNDNNQQVMDRRTKKFRQLRGGDIAVLCPINSMLTTYADVLRAQGLHVRLQASGWFSSRSVQIALQALAYLANPANQYAALYLAVTDLGSFSLKEALTQLMGEGRINEPLLAKLNKFAEGTTDQTVYALVADMFRKLGLLDVVALWPDGEQARANLRRLLAEAGEFMDANRETLAKGGFHGAGVQTFLSWIAAKVKEKDGDKQPDPRVLDENAIVLTTWHASKGREWPVVAVCGLDREVKVKLPNVELVCETFDELSRLSEHTRIEYSPEFAARDTNDLFLSKLQGPEETKVRRLLYVALTRARDKLIIEWPGYLTGKGKAGKGKAGKGKAGKGKAGKDKAGKDKAGKDKAGKDKATYWSILTKNCALSLATDRMRVGEQDFSCTVLEGLAELPEELDISRGPDDSVLPVIGRRAIQPNTTQGTLTSDSRTPSEKRTSKDTEERTGLVVEEYEEKLDVEEYGKGLDVAKYGKELKVNIGLSKDKLGTFIHRCFEVLGSRPDLMEEIPQITGVKIESDELMKIAASVKRFEDWLKGYFDIKSVRREWPILRLDGKKTVVSGNVDLIVETPKGLWVIDHKSGETNNFKEHQAQLKDYASALVDENKLVLGIAINWTRRREVVLQKRKMK